MMKKTLVAAAALAATGAFAQVTLSGNLDYSTYAQGAQQSATSNANSTSLWRLTGTENLDNGSKVSFNLVSELNLQKGQTGSTSTGAAATTATTPDVFNRGANIEFSSGIGSIIVGRQGDAWWESQNAFNTSGSASFGFGALTGNQSNAATANGITAATAVAASTNAGLAGMVTNVANAGYTGTSFTFASGLSYTTPDLNGFKAKIQQNVAEYSSSTGQTVNPGAAMSLNYATPAFKAFAATTYKGGTDGLVAWTQTGYGASYTLGAATLTVASNKATFTNSAVALNDSTATGFGVTYVFSPVLDASFSYGSLTNDETTANKATLIGITGRYALSKRTQVYAGFGSINNEGAATVSAIWSGSGQTVGASTSSSLLGLRHQF